jgi:hypothetical protein
MSRDLAMHRMARELRSSPDPTDRRSVFFGSILGTNAPALIPIELIKENVWMRGDTGSGKTAQMMMLMEQIATIEPCTIHVFDLKGSPELFATAKAIMPDILQWFTDRVDCSTHVFNVFQQPLWEMFTPDQKAANLVSAFDVDYGGSTVYGPGFFADNAHECLAKLAEYHSVKNFIEVDERIDQLVRSKKITAKVRDAGLHAQLVCRRFARVQALNAKNSIDLLDGFSRPQIVYWCLPVDLGFKTAANICRFATSMLLTAANALSQAERKIPVYVFVDEFQRALGLRAIKQLEASRSKGVASILAHQSTAQLYELGKGTAENMAACCRVHWTFAVGDTQEQVDLSRQSGERHHDRISQSFAPGSLLGDRITTTYTPIVSPALEVNDIKAVSSRPKLSLLRCTKDDGHWLYRDRFVPVRAYFHIDREEYERRKNFPWPGPVPGCIVTNMPKPLAVEALPPGLFPPPQQGKRKPLHPPRG